MYSSRGLTPRGKRECIFFASCGYQRGFAALVLKTPLEAHLGKRLPAQRLGGGEVRFKDARWAILVRKCVHWETKIIRWPILILLALLVVILMYNHFSVAFVQLASPKDTL